MIAKCQNCHHEVQAVRLPPSCDWCGGAMVKIAKDYMGRIALTILVALVFIYAPIIITIPTMESGS